VSSNHATGPGKPRLPVWPALLLIVIGGLPLYGDRFLVRMSEFGYRLAYQLYATLLICSAGFLAVWLVESARRRPKPEPSPHKQTRRFALPKSERLNRLRARIPAIDWRGGWLAVPLTLGLTGLAGAALFKAWPILYANSTAPFDQMAAGLLVVAAFPILVLERHLAGKPPRLFPEAQALSRLSRLPLAVLLLLALAAGTRWLGLDWWQTIERAVDILLGLVAAELFLRNVVYLFLPLPPLEVRTGQADSFVAGLIRLQRPSLGAIGETVRRQFGLDLTRSWALLFIRRASFPVLLGMIVFCWLLTGVTALPLDQRAAYQAFGRPAGVFRPGLHIHLPWPFGLLKPVDYGVVHEIPIIFAAEDGTIDTSESDAPLADADIEGSPPWSSNRLWDASHPAEASYLVANLSNGRQSFEIVNIDLRVVYRIGLSDLAAQQTVYNIASADAMIRSAAGQMLARHFARRTIDDVLGQNRDAFVRGFQAELQSRLTDLSSGVEIMAVVVEAIHPPADAAPSYQGVQASAIRSQARVSLAKAAAIRAVKEAEQTATTARDEALSAAAERVEEARTELTLFQGDRQAHIAGGQSFLFERRLDRLDKSLAETPLVIVDHRISPAEAPTLDLRTPSSALTDAGQPND